jgi:hypothetical protein
VITTSREIAGKSTASREPNQAKCWVRVVRWRDWQASNLDLEAWGGVSAVSCSSRVYSEQLKPEPAGADELLSIGSFLWRWIFAI